MNEVESIVDKIKALLLEEGAPVAQTLTELHEGYVNAVKECNDRLKRCHELMRKGERAETIHQCELEPNLLDVVEWLDFPERAQWYEYLRSYGLTTPPEILSELAAQIDAAYADEQRLARLMGRHRSLALAGAGLPERLALMRKIAPLDPDNGFWVEDIRTLERARHKQLKGEIRRAANAGNLATLAALAKETASDEWLERPAEDVISQSRVMYEKQRRESARLKMHQLADAVHHVAAAPDVEKLRALRSQWEATGRVAELLPEDPIHDVVAPTFEWLAERERALVQEQTFQNLRLHLEELLDQNGSQEEIERVYYALAATPQGVDRGLESRYQSRLETFKIDSARRSRNRMIVSVMALFVLGSLTFLASRHLIGLRTLAKHQGVIAGLLADGNHAGASDYLKHLIAQDPHLGEQPELKTLAIEVERATTKEIQRAENFRQQVANVESCLAEPDWACLKRHLAGMDELSEQAATPGEQAQITELTQQLYRHQRQLQGQVDQEFAESFESFQQACAEQKDKFDLETLKRLSQQGSELLAQPRVTVELKAPLELILAQLKSKRVTLQTKLYEVARINKITSTIRSPTGFRQALQTYCKEEGGSPSRIEDFKKLLSEADLFAEVAPWQKLLSSWGELSFNTLSPQAAAEQLQAYRDLQTAGLEFPLTSELAPHERHLVAIAARDSEGFREKWDALRGLTQHPLVADIFLVRTQTETYYSKQAPRPSGNGWSFPRLTDATDLTELKPTFVKSDDLATSPSAGAWETTSPQSQFREVLVGALGKFRAEQWDEFFANLLTQLSQEADMEPIVRLAFTKVILEAGAEGSAAMRQVFATPLAQVEELDLAQLLGEVNWLDHADPDGNLKRTEADGQLQGLGDLSDRESSLVMAAQLPTLRKLGWVGWLHRDEANKWTCSFREGLAPKVKNTELFLLHPGTSKTAALTPLGTWGPTLEIDNISAQMLEGRAVYASARPAQSQSKVAAYLRQTE